MSYLSPTIREELLETLEAKEAQLVLVRAQITELLDTPVEEYRFNAGDGGNQWARRRSLRQVKEMEASLEQEIENIKRRLRGAGLLNIVQRRR